MPDNANMPIAEAAPDEVTPEILKVIQTAASMYLGKKVRIVSVKARPTVDANSSAWASQDAISFSLRTTWCRAGVGSGFPRH